MTYTYEFPRPGVTLDSAVLRLHAGKVEILLITRGHGPFQGMCALPGGFLEMDEEPVTGAARELSEETGLRDIQLSPLFGAGQVGRDPRCRNITLVFGALVRGDDLQPSGSDDAVHAGWFPLDQPPAMAFDHATILQEISLSLRWQARTAVVGRRLFPGGFAAGELVALHAALIGENSGDPVERGLRLGLLESIDGPTPCGSPGAAGAQPGATTGQADRFRFRVPATEQPDWTPLPW